MTFEILRKQPVKFYQQNGIKFFEPFKAVDKFKKPLELSWNSHPVSPSIRAKSTYNNDASIYDMEIDYFNKELKGTSIVAQPKNKGIGEVLNLASLITFKENNFSEYNVFALRDYIQFYTKYGFNILTNNINEIVHNLKIIAKSKDKRFSDLADSAQFFIKKIDKATEKEKLNYFSLSNNLVSDYLRNLARNGEKADHNDLYSHTHMHFTTMDTARNKDYINKLLDKHEINYEI